EARCVITQLFSALNYLNQIDPPVIHFDLKPANILYQNNEIKVTDFGLSKVMKECDLVNGDEMELTSQGAGTYWYLPPETFLLNNSVTISSKVDVWSAGIIFYQLLYGKRPFGDEMSQNSLRQTGTILNAREVTFPPRPVVSDDTKEFISLCLTYNKEARPDVLTMCRFPYLASGKR
ncbi:TLK protein kinase, partial [Sphaeroforma arctica JP610]